MIICKCNFNGDIKITKDERNDWNRNSQVEKKVDNGDASRQKQLQLEESGLKIHVFKNYFGYLKLLQTP